MDSRNNFYPEPVWVGIEPPPLFGHHSEIEEKNIINSNFTLNEFKILTLKTCKT
ncbi:hypothetical protein HanPI659440_Chr13g0519141 [Helianthus annuus]|nr:hypothetical protein HanPI659440_Chr13g0519141 [Helianthus annuus]